MIRYSFSLVRFENIVDNNPKGFTVKISTYTACRKPLSWRKIYVMWEIRSHESMMSRLLKAAIMGVPLLSSNLCDTLSVS